MKNMASIRVVHQCLFCPQIFGSAAEKDDHILGHFAQETCGDCNQNLIRIGGTLYTVHNSTTCIRKETKSEEHIKSCFMHTEIVEPIAENKMGVKIEPDAIDLNQHVNGENLLKCLIEGCNERFVIAKDRDEHMQTHTILKDEEAMELLEETGWSSNEEQSEGDYSTVTDTIWKNDMQIKAEPTFESSSDQTEIKHITQSEEMASIRTNQQSGLHFASESDLSHVETTERNMKNSSTSSNRQQSQRNKNQKKPFECDICGGTFSRRTSLKCHKVVQHSAPGTHFCKYCGKIFGTVDKIAHHLSECKRKKVRGSSFNCNVCNRTLNSLYAFRAHMESQHDPSNRFKCELCIADFATKAALERHSAHHDSGTRIACHICGKYYAGYESLKSHEIRKHSEPGTHFCTICSKIFPTEKVLIAHKLLCEFNKRLLHEVRKSTDKNASYECYICPGKPYRTLGFLRSHFRLKHTLEGTKFKCNMCEKGYFHQSQLDLHTKRSHNTPLNDRKFMCAVCGKYLSFKNGLRTHMLHVHANHVQKPFKCNWEKCNKSFTDKRKMIIHLRSHTGEQPYECEIDGCDRRFRHARELSRHKARIHGIFTKKFPCTICSEIFPEIVLLKKHMKKHDPAGPLKCTFKGCNEEIQTKFEMVEHMCSHTAEKPYECGIDGCDKRFNYTQDVNRHKFRIHGIYTKKFPCTICNEILPENCKLIAHMKKHHS